MRVDDISIRRAIPEMKIINGSKYFRSIAVYTTRKEADQEAGKARELYHNVLSVRVIRYIVNGKAYYALFVKDMPKPTKAYHKKYQSHVTRTSMKHQK